MFTKVKALLFSTTSRDTLISFIGLGTIAAVGMLFTVITARAMGPETFGLFTALNVIVTLASGVGDFGISAALVNFLPKMVDRRSVLISVTFWFQLLISFFIGLTVLAIGLIPGFIVPGSTSTHFIIVAFLTVIYIFQGFAVGLFNAEKKFLQSSIVQASDSIIKLILVSAIFFSERLNIEIALLANILSCAISVIYGLRNELSVIRPIFPKSQLTPIISFSRWIALTRIFSVMISRVDVLLLNLFVGAFQTGIFAAASRITLLFALLVSSIGSVTAPRFSSFINKKDIITYIKKVSLLVAGVSVFMLLTLIFAKPLILLVFGTKYLPSVPVFQALTIAMIPFLLSIITTQPLVYSFNQPHFMAKITILQVTLIVFMDILLIPKFFSLAPAISLGITNTIVLVISAYKLRILVTNA